MGTSPGGIIKQLGDQYELLIDNLEPLLSACDEERISEQLRDDLLKQLRETLEDALENYMKAQHQIFAAGIEQLKRLAKAIDGTQQRMAAALKDRTNIKDVLDTIGQIVNELTVEAATLYGEPI